MIHHFVSRCDRFTRHDTVLYCTVLYRSSQDPPLRPEAAPSGMDVEVLDEEEEEEAARGPRERGKVWVPPRVHSRVRGASPRGVTEPRAMTVS